MSGAEPVKQATSPRIDVNSAFIRPDLTLKKCDDVPDSLSLKSACHGATTSLKRIPETIQISCTGSDKSSACVTRQLSTGNGHSTQRRAAGAMVTREARSRLPPPNGGSPPASQPDTSAELNNFAKHDAKSRQEFVDAPPPWSRFQQSRIILNDGTASRPNGQPTFTIVTEVPRVPST